MCRKEQCRECRERWRLKKETILARRCPESEVLNVPPSRASPPLIAQPLPAWQRHLALVASHNEEQYLIRQDARFGSAHVCVSHSEQGSSSGGARASNNLGLNCRSTKWASHFSAGHKKVSSSESGFLPDQILLLIGPGTTSLLDQSLQATMVPVLSLVSRPEDIALKLLSVSDVQHLVDSIREISERHSDRSVNKSSTLEHST
jgi:hypothetical protein